MINKNTNTSNNTFIKSIVLPPVSNQFYKELIKYYPNKNISTISNNTTLQELHREAGRQDVINFIKRFVKEDGEEYKLTLLDKIKILFS